MKIKKAAAVKLLTALGVDNAEKLATKTVQTKLNKLDQIADEDTEMDSESLQSGFDKVMGALSEGSAITVVDDAKAKEPEGKKASSSSKEKKKSGKSKTTDKPGGSGVKKRKKKKESEESDEKPKKKKEGPVGVRATRGRPYLAGIILKKHGLKEGITDDMVSELDEAMGEGKANPRENMFVLRNAWHALRGYLNKDNEGDLEPPSEEE